MVQVIAIEDRPTIIRTSTPLGGPLDQSRVQRLRVANATTAKIMALVQTMWSVLFWTIGERANGRAGKHAAQIQSEPIRC
jgi:hypothetical protein